MTIALMSTGCSCSKRSLDRYEENATVQSKQFLTRTQIINEVIQKNADENPGCYFLWLADAYDTLPAITEERTMATRPPITLHWRSPFLNKSLQDVADFVRSAPKPLCRLYFAVLEKERYLNDNEIRLCKIEGDQVQSFPYDAHMVATYFQSVYDDIWTEDWQSFGDSQGAR